MTQMPPVLHPKLRSFKLETDSLSSDYASIQKAKVDTLWAGVVITKDNQNKSDWPKVVSDGIYLLVIGAIVITLIRKFF